MIEYTLRRGWRRRLWFYFRASVYLLGAWLWLGNAGVGLMALWVSTFYPRWQTKDVRVRLADVSFAYFWGRSFFLQTHDRRQEWVFADEIDEREFARLRRRVMTHLRALL